MVFAFYLGSSQQAYENQINIRDSLIGLYQSHHDTVSVNTWLNIRRSNQYLEKIIHIDSIIISQLLKDNTSDQESFTKAEAKSYLLKQQVDSLNRILENDAKFEVANHRSDNSPIIFGGVLVVFFLGSWAYFIFLSRKLKDKETRLKQYHSDLYAARQELEDMEKTHITLASEVNRLKRELASFEENHKLLQQLADDKLLLEQQIEEVTKAYGAESEKRKAAENELMLLEDEKNTQIHDLQSDIALLKEGLTVAESFQSKLLKEFNGLINKIRNRFN
jgi:DNA repair exonuclease SbcCD ATPase subunit